ELTPGDSLPGWGWMAAPRSVSAAFQEYLQHLGLQDFPCGIGSWNKSRFHGRRSSRLEEAVPPGEESPEALLELLRDPHSPWALPPECSPLDRLLREVAVLAPELLRGSGIFQLVKSLRILDKGVSAVDEGLLQFQQLEELILSANHISRVSSAHLPRTLKVLELCYNAVGDLQDLCAQPPPELQHLGLGYNRLLLAASPPSLGSLLRPNLISLDLSFNSLTDLPGLVSQLSTLPNLHILLLQGNPLALTPTYRGFLVDSLPKLSILDDIHIWPEEREHFYGLARQPGDEARVVVSIGELKGLPNPEAFQQLEVGSEGPVITYSYYVTYEFAEGEELEDRGSPEVADGSGMGSSSAGDRIPMWLHPAAQAPAAHIPHPSWGAQSSAPGTAVTGPLLLTVAEPFPGTEVPSSHEGGLRNRILEADPSLPGNKNPPEFHSGPAGCGQLCSGHRGNKEPSGTSKVFATPGQPWADTIDCSYRKEHVDKDLVGLKAYLEAGTIVSVVEEKVRVWLSWMKGEELLGGPAKENAATNKKEGQGLKKNNKKKKQQQQPSEFRSDPPIRSTLGTTRVTLDTLLATEDLVATVCDFGILIPEKPPVVEEKVRSMSQGRAAGWGSSSGLLSQQRCLICQK
uniref:Leucine rich repeat containing 43 n=1 Tax=Catharus ustulatus TaxID=91951 RepID=A0A8C3UL57_CATUS